MRRAVTEAGQGVRLLEVAPDLAASVDAGSRAAAMEQSRVATLSLRRGGWREAAWFGGSEVALYVISGFVSRRVDVQEGSGIELLGPGQILRPALTGAEEALRGRVEWEMLSPACLAVLALAFWEAMAAYPRLLLALFDRGLWRSRSLSVQLAIAGSGHVSDRVLKLLWQLADSYGRVTKEGVALPLNLSHELLAQMVGATRPPVSRAVKELERQGWISRDAERGFVLHGDGPSVQEWA